METQAIIDEIEQLLSALCFLGQNILNYSEREKNLNFCCPQRKKTREKSARDKGGRVGRGLNGGLVIA